MSQDARFVEVVLTSKIHHTSVRNTVSTSTTCIFVSAGDHNTVTCTFEPRSQLKQSGRHLSFPGFFSQEVFSVEFHK